MLSNIVIMLKKHLFFIGIFFGILFSSLLLYFNYLFFISLIPSLIDKSLLITKSVLIKDAIEAFYLFLSFLYLLLFFFVFLAFSFFFLKTEVNNG